MAKAPTFEERKAHYEAQWSIMTVKPERVSSVDRSARLAISNKSRYLAVAKATNVPWPVIAIIHMREASGSFAGVLHNGEHIIGTGRKTTLVPKGRGPFATWEAAAIDALKMRGMGSVKDWSIARICYETEAFNGWGYWWHGDKSSAYLWAGTNIDGGGKYIADGVWSSTTQDAQNGCMAVLKRIIELDATVALVIGLSAPTAPAPAPAPKPAPAPAPAPAPKPAPAPQKSSWLSALLGALSAIFKKKT